MMSLEFTFKLIAGFLTVGILQSSIEQLILFIKFPAIINHPLDKGIVKSPLAKKLSFLYNTPIVGVFAILRVLLALALLLPIYCYQFYFLLPLGLITIDVIGFFRWKFMPSSDVPMQRVILIALSLHYFFQSSEISHLVLIAICGFLVLAYLAAGFKKTQTLNWTQGHLMSNLALKDALPFSNNKKLWKSLAYLVIFFECSFFIALFNTKLALVYLMAGFLFHLYLYLKRQFSFFFWTFVAAYPAFYFVAEQVSLWLNI